MKDDLVYIEHIKDCIRKIKEYTKDLDEEQFIKNEIIQDAAIRNIEIIGEAAKKISKNLRTTYFEIPWKQIAGMRDKLVDDYMGTDLEVVWKTITEDIVYLENMINNIEI